MTDDIFEKVFKMDSNTLVESQIKYIKKINSENGTDYSQSTLSRRLENLGYTIKKGWLIPPATVIEKIRNELIGLMENESCRYMFITEYLLYINVNNGYGSRIKHLFKKAFDSVIMSIFNDENDNLLIVMSINDNDNDIKRFLESSDKLIRLN